jgi:hypothetical protein
LYSNLIFCRGKRHKTAFTVAVPFGLLFYFDFFPFFFLRKLFPKQKMGKIPYFTFAVLHQYFPTKNNKKVQNKTRHREKSLVLQFLQKIKIS